MRYVGFLTLLVIGVTMMMISDADGLRWWVSLPLFMCGFIISGEAIRADERHRHGL
jgi:hypothetical protein